MKLKIQKAKGKMSGPNLINLRRGGIVALFCILIFAVCISEVRAQSRDFLTAAEIDLVRDAQEIDLRIAVLVRAADRRFGVLNVDVAAPVIKKQSEAWGELPKGERIELLFDVKRLLQKAIDDIDNLSERPEAAILPDPEIKNPKTLADLFPVAVRSLAAAAARYKPALQKELDTTTDKMEQGVIMDIIESCDQIIAAVPKLPPVVEKKKKKT